MTNQEHATCEVIQELRRAVGDNAASKQIKKQGFVVGYDFDLEHGCPMNRYEFEALPCDRCVRLHPGAPPITAPPIAKRRSRKGRGRRKAGK